MKKKILLLALILGIGHTSSIAQTVINLAYCSENGLYNGLYAHPGNCHWFYRCWDGNTIALQCPAGQAYDVMEQVCDYEDLAVNPAPPCTVH